jgi:hypothetical protein
VLSGRAPGTRGTLIFTTVQTYSNGDVVRWIGDPGADLPASRVTVTRRAGQAPATAPAASDDEGGRDGLTLGLTIAGLVAGLAALGVALFRRPKAA